MIKILKRSDWLYWVLCPCIDLGKRVGTVGEKTCLRLSSHQNKMELGSGSLLKEKQWTTARRKGYPCRTSKTHQNSTLVVIFCIVQRCDSGLRSSSGWCQNDRVGL